MNFRAIIMRFLCLASLLGALVSCRQVSEPDLPDITEPVFTPTIEPTPGPATVTATVASATSVADTPGPTITTEPVAAETTAAEAEGQESRSPTTAVSDESPSNAYPVITANNADELVEIAVLEPGYWASWSRDGSMLVSMDLTGVVYLWDVVAWDFSAIDTGFTQGLSDVSLSSDNGRIATSDYEGPVRIWDSTSGQELLELALSGEINREVAWAPDDSLIAIGACCGSLQLWDPETGDYRELEGHRGSILDLAWSPDGNYLASASTDSSVQVWSAASGQRISLLLGHMGDTLRVDWAPDGRRLASCGLDGTVRIWDVQTGEELADLSELEGCVSWSPDGRLLASSGAAVNLWDSENEQTVAAIDLAGNAIWSPDGTMLAVAGDQLRLFAVPAEDSETRYLNVTPVNMADISGWSKFDYELPGGPAVGVQAITVDADGRAWFATMNDGVNLLDNDTWTTYRAGNSELPEDYVTSITIDADGRVWVGTRKGISIIDGENWFNYNAENSGLPGYDSDSVDTVMNITFDGEENAWISSFGGKLTRYDGQEWTTMASNTVEEMATDSQGRVWIGTPGNGVIMFDGQEKQTFLEDSDGWTRSIVVDDEDRIWVANGQEVNSYDGESWTDYGSALPTGSREIQQLAVAPDGTLWALNSRGELYALESDGSWTDYSSLRDPETVYRTEVFVIDQQNRLWFEDYYLEPLAK